MIVPEGAESKVLTVDGVRVHYFEGGAPGKPHLVLLHSCEFGASAEFSWEHNFRTLADEYHVVAPDWLGYGYTDKLYDFGLGPAARRLSVLQRFLEALRIDDADFIGNSCGGSFLLQWTATAGANYRDVLPIRRMVMVSPSIIGQPGPGRIALNDYDGTRQAMRAVVAALFYGDTWAQDDAYVDRRQASGLLPGHWECVAAARFKMPSRASSGFQSPPFDRCVAPVLIITGGADKVVGEPNGGIDNVRGIRTAELDVFPESGHCSHIEHPARFHERALGYLKARHPTPPLATAAGRVRNE